MKAKVDRGDSFRGILDYALGKEGGNACEIVGGNMAGMTARDLATEFGLSREARPNVKRPVWHTSLSLPPGETADSEKWAEIASDFMQGMGLAHHQYVVIQHHDTEIDHVHLISSRIALDGDLYHGAWDAKKAISLTQKLEEKHGLTRTKGLENGPAPQAAPSRNEIEKAVRTGDAPPRLMLQQIVDAAITDPGSVFDFMDRIEAAGAVARPNVAKTGRMNGFSFEFEGIHFKGSDLGKAYTWKSLQERGLDYEQERDGDALRARASGAFAGASQIDSGRSVPADRQIGPVGIGPDSADRGTAHSSQPPWNGDDQNGEAGKPVHREGTSGRGNDLGPGDSYADQDRGVGAGGSEISESDSSPSSVSVGNAGGTGQPPALDSDRSSGSLRILDWNRVADRTADLAASAYPVSLVDRESDRNSNVTPAITAKRSAWDEQHGALQAPAYRLTLMSRVEGLSSFNVGKGRGPDGSEKTYDPNEVRSLIPYLSAHNSRGRDIYLTPMDPTHHYMVVDDMTPTAVEDFLAAGYAPALIQESSAGNRQAIIKVPKVSGGTEQSAANEVVVDLNRRYGDQNFSGVIHPFRMAGFSNKKPSRNNAFTRILRAAGDLCSRTLSQLEAVRQRLSGNDLSVRAGAPAPVRTPMPSRQKSWQADPSISDGDTAFIRARRLAENLAKMKGWTLDQSRLDYRAAKTMAAAGFQKDEIAAAIMSSSPDLTERHSDPLGYAARTAESVLVITDRTEPQEPQGDHPKDDGPEGPGDM